MKNNTFSFQVHNWRKLSKDLFFFRPTTQEKEVINSDENDVILCDDDMTDDDILYSQPTTYEGSQWHTLCFVHQSVEQLAILKRFITLLFTRTHFSVNHKQNNLTTLINSYSDILTWYLRMLHTKHVNWLFRCFFWL